MTITARELVLDALRRWITDPDDDLIGARLGSALRELGADPADVIAVARRAAGGGGA